MVFRAVTGVLLAILCISSWSWAATPEQVGEAIRKGREWLLKVQKNGNWEKVPSPSEKSNWSTEGGQYGGLTALATYALLASGEPVSNPDIQEAIKWLRNADIKGVYALGMRAQIWGMLPKADWVEEAMARDLELLLAGVLQQPDNRGLYDYLTPSSPTNARVDHSVSQYGVLGVWALEKSGAPVPPRYWEFVEDIWTKHQDVSGGWCYERMPNAGHPINISMTAAGVATLYITQDYLHANEGIQPRGNITRPEIEAGLKWMTDNFQKVGDDWYSWYGIERIGVASGLKYFGPHNWYEIGADLMVKRQTAEGKWNYNRGGRSDVVGTSFCLLFLSRGRAPIMMSKLQYETIDARGNKSEGLWNQRPREVANLTTWVGRRIEQDLNWQVVNLNAPVDELAETPIIYMSGSAAFNLSEEHREKLKTYIENGGMVLGNADGGRPAFTEAFKKLGESMFPGYKFRDLPERHPIYTEQQFQRSRWRTRPPVQGLSNGARELMIIIPQVDPARQWQMNDDSRREELFQLPANIFLYAVDKTMQFKGERRLLKENTSISPERTISVARIEYDGNWNPEPGGWRRMQAYMRNNRRVALKVEPVKLGSGALAATYKVAHLTGTESVKFTQEQRDEIKSFVEKGGTLIIDAAGGSAEFRSSIENELAIIFGPDAAKAVSSSLKPDSPLYTALGDAARDVQYRQYARLELGRLPKDPRFRAIEVGGRFGVIYSPQDMTVGMVGHPVDGIFGYEPESASKLMAALLTYASQ